MTLYDVVTLNDDFTDLRTDLASVLKPREGNGRRPLAVLLQEGKRSRYRRVLRRLRRKAGLADNARRLAALGSYRAAQVLDTDATRGLAIVWDTDQATLHAGPFYQELVEPDGAAMLPRGVLWIVVRLRASGDLIVLATTHRPPKRYGFLWPRFDYALKDWAKDRRAVGLSIILGLDTNTPNLAELAHRVGMKVAGVAIDAVMVSRDLKVWGATKLRRRTSDHAPVRTTVVVP